jgi:hypothetical protein
MMAQQRRTHFAALSLAILFTVFDKETSLTETA